jgi:hypothetical protein
VLELVRPLGHDAVVGRLVATARAGRLPHALLFTGPAGIGKARAALWLAATLLCEREGDGPCMECGPCKRVRSDQHADVFVVDAREHDQDEITVFFVAHRDDRPQTAYQGPSIEDFLGLRAAEDRGKYVVVRDADRMNEAAQNAFLKMLEEPRPGVHLLLETANPGALLQTVRSRVVTERFAPLDPRTCAEVLFTAGGFDRSNAEDVAAVDVLGRLAGGAPGAALELHARSAPRIAELLGDAFAGARPAGEVAAELWDLDGDFPGKSAFVRRRVRAETILDLGLEVLVDVERRIAGLPPEGLRHGEVAERLAGDRRFVREADRRRMGESWLSAREDLHLNLSPEGLVDRALAAAAPR